MNNLIKITFFVFLLSCGQDITYENNIKEDLIFLADDKLEGRKTGTEGEKLAAKYISDRFEKLNLSDKGTENYYQDFYFGNNNNPHEEIEFNKESDNSNSSTPSLPSPITPEKLAKRRQAVKWSLQARKSVPLRPLRWDSESSQGEETGKTIKRSRGIRKYKSCQSLFVRQHVPRSNLRR